MSTISFYLDDVWGKVKTKIKDSGHFDETIYRTYFENSVLFDLNDNKAIVIVPSYFQKLVLTEEIPMINATLQNILDKDRINCEVMVKGEADKLRPAHNYNQTPNHNYLIKDDGISPTHTFDNFVVGPSNKECHAAALGCAYRPGQFYTPLFVYGNSGLGKTHLLYAIGNFVKKNAPNSKVMYTSSSDFVRQVANSIGNGSIEQFKDEMYSLDVLLIDDIQFLAGKEKSHEIFFHIFNELAYNKKQIVITSDRHPSEIKGLEERLISRFSSGLSVGVDTPEFETSLAILQMKIRNQSIDPSVFDEDALHYLASNFSKDIRQLEGALNRILFFSIEFSDSNHITLETVMLAFKGEVVPPKELDCKTIKRIVADYYGLTTTQLVGKSRTKAISNARHIAIYLIRKILDLPYNRIGEEFGKRDHSTIISAYDKIDKGIKNEPLLQTAINEIEAKLK